jgi:KEOPS complex subunit Cgi121
VYKDTLRDYPDIQVVDSKLLYGVEHLEFAIQKAKMALDNGGGISSNIFMETIVRASGQRQIKKALEKYGLKGSTEIAIFGERIPGEVQTLLGAEEIEIKIDSHRLESLKEAFSIKDEELNSMSDFPAEAVKDLIKERIALVSIL